MGPNIVGSLQLCCRQLDSTFFFYLSNMEKGYQLKEIFNDKMVARIASDIHGVWNEFDKNTFERDINKSLKPLSLTERGNLIMEEMANHLPGHFPKAVEILVASFGKEMTDPEFTGFDGFYYLPHGNYIAKYGLDHFDLSTNALKEITKRFTAEFPIRSFIQHHPEKSLKLLHLWSGDENLHVRRLASEGMRPRLPWAPQLTEFIKDPSPVLAVLNKLKDDPELYVRRSVANNLNDIAKDHTDLVVDVLTDWSKGASQGTEWIIKHAARSLIKSGNVKVLSLLGYNPDVAVDVYDFKASKNISMGGELEFSFKLESSSSKTENLMVDYIIHFMKANGKTAPKVFKLSKKKIKPGETVNVKSKQSFKPISTRKYYPGKHAISLQINGKVYGKEDFVVK